MKKRPRNEKILLAQTSFLGDTILSTPVIAGIRTLWPECELWMMTTPLSRALVERDPFLQGVIVHDKHGTEKGLAGTWRQIRRIRDMEFDRVYALHRSHRTGIMLRLARIPLRIGFRDSGFSFLYTDRRDRPSGTHDVIRNLSLLAGDRPLTDFSDELRLFPPGRPFLSTAVRERLPDAETYVLMAPGSVWATKRWDWRKYRALAVHLRKEGLPVVLMGGPEDLPVTARVSEGLDLIDLTGKSGIADAMEIVHGARLVICNDSMTLHLASALKKPTAAIFCATAPEMGFGPWKNDRAIVVERHLPCRPCSPHGTRKCPNGSNACMAVGEEEVLQAIKTLNALP